MNVKAKVKVRAKVGIELKQQVLELEPEVNSSAFPPERYG